MKIKNTEAVQVWQARLDRAQEIGGKKAKSVGEVDLAKQAAAKALLQKATDTAQALGLEDPVKIGERLWAERGRGGIPGLVDRILDSSERAKLTPIGKASFEEIGLIVDELALRMLVESHEVERVGGTSGTSASPFQAREEALGRLLDLKTVCGAGKDIVKEYNLRLRSTPSRLRQDADFIDQRVHRALGAVEDRLDDLLGRDVIGKVASNVAAFNTTLTRWLRKNSPEDVAETAGTASESVLEVGEQALSWILKKADDLEVKKRSLKVFDQAKQLVLDAHEQIGFGQGTEARTKVESAVRSSFDKMKSLGDGVLPKGFWGHLEGFKESAGKLIGALVNIEKDLNNNDAVVGRFCDSLESSLPVIDPEADAIAFGQANEAALLITGSKGLEYVYNREKKEMTINRLSGVGARMGIGGSKRFFGRVIYGDADAIDSSKWRGGTEVGAFMAHVGLFSCQAEDEKKAPYGYQIAPSADAYLSIPVLADQSVFAFKQSVERRFEVSQDQANQIEKLLENVPESGRDWTRSIRRSIKPDDQ